MRLTERIFLLCIGVLAVACGPRKTAPAAAPTRSFPMAEVPRMITEPQDRMVWLAQHFWDRYTSVDSLYFCDSVTVNGVPKDKLEEQTGLFVTFLQQISLPDGSKAVNACYERLEAFQTAHPSGNVFPEVTALVSRYLYDPNSPVRSEELYLPFVSRLASSPLVDPAMRPAYGWDARMCSLNRLGTPAADFTFVDTAGRRRTLYSIKANRTLLIFGNPDCHACKELVEAIGGDPELLDLITSGAVKVVDIYIDEDIDLWKERMADYPKDWINGYDPAFVIRTDKLYNVRALPSLYLLDEGKNVLLKDATTVEVLDALYPGVE